MLSMADASEGLVFNIERNNDSPNMLPKLFVLLTSLGIAISAYGHGDVEIGPKGGRILALDEDGTSLAEISVKNGKFRVEVLDKDMRPVPLTEQVLTVTVGDRAKPEKLPVEKVEGKYFESPTVKPGQWVIFQFRQQPKAKPFTARLEYDTRLSSDGKTPFWLHSH